MPETDLAVHPTPPSPPPGEPEAWRTPLAKRLEKGDFDLPMLPRTATEVVRLAGDSEGDAPRLSEVIHRDPALAGYVLRIANSPAYLPRTPIVSLQQAVTRLGFTVLGEIALAASLQSGIFHVGRHEGDLQRLWKHALASAGFAREIARDKRANVENAFLCGLLHGIGKPAVLQLVADLESEREEEIPGETLDALLDEFHVGIGAALAERWELPSPVQEALAHYRDVGRTNALPVGVLVTATASQLATHLLTPEDLDEATLRAHPGFAALNLYPEDVDALLEKREAVRALVGSMTL